MSAKDDISPVWLRLHPLPVSGDPKAPLSSATKVPEEKLLQHIVAFEDWSTFDAETTKVGEVLKALPATDRHRDILSEAVFYFNQSGRSLDEKYQGDVSRTAVHDEDAVNAFSELSTVATKALRIPALREGLVCEPWQLEKRRSEYICCSRRNERSSNNSSQVVLMETGCIEEGATDKPAHTRVIKPDITMYTTLRRTESSGMPVLAVEGKKPTIRFGGTLGITTTGETVAVRVADLFKRARVDRIDLNPEEMTLYYALCQSILYALQTESQSVVATNRNETLFLRIMSVGKESPMKVKVAVSSLYNGNSMLCAVISCIRSSFSQYFDGIVDWSERVAFLRSLKTDDPDYVPDLFEMDDKDRSLEPADDGATSNGQVGRNRNLAISPPASLSSLSKLSFIEENASQNDSPNSVCRVYRGKQVSGYALQGLMNHNCGFLAENGYNHVMLCRLANRRFVAVKYFVSLEEKRVASKLEHEIAVHSMMERRCQASEYGKFVSELIAFGNVNSYGIVVVTAYVGLPVTKSGADILVGAEQVVNVEELRNAAVQSLQWIHGLHILHGDVSLRNMRAERTCNGEWKVWWLDFGESKDSRNRKAFSEELAYCRAMFDRRSRDKV